MNGLLRHLYMLLLGPISRELLYQRAPPFLVTWEIETICGPKSYISLGEDFSYELLTWHVNKVVKRK